MAFSDNRQKNGGNFFNLIEGKTKVDVATIITDYPDGVHITGCTVMKNKRGEDISAFTFNEIPAGFFFGGVILTKLAKDWIENNGGTSEECTERLKKELPLMRLFTKNSASGNRYTDYEIIEETEKPVLDELPFN